MIKTLSVILPLYNEEKRLNDLFIKISKFKFLNKNKLEFIFVDDGSNDNSYLLIKNFINKNKKRIDLKLVSYKNNKGKGTKPGPFNAPGLKQMLLLLLDLHYMIFTVVKILVELLLEELQHLELPSYLIELELFYKNKEILQLNHLELV